MSDKPAVPPPSLPPEVEAAVVADALRVAGGMLSDRIAFAATALKLFRAEMAKP